MRYFLSVVCLVIVHWAMSQQDQFNFEEAWEAVYQAEMQYLPKSARAKVDSIYEAADRFNEPEHLSKALIYQSKFFLILEKDGEKKLPASEN